MNEVSIGLGVGPLAEFLCQPAVVGVRPDVVGETGFKIEPATGEELLQRLALGRCIRVQRKVHPGDGDIKTCFKLFNTPGAEVTPRSPGQRG